MNPLKEKNLLLVLLATLAINAVPVRAGGPLYVTGRNADNPGKAYRWTLNPLPYRTDRGGLGNQTNTQANDLVSSAFQVWQDVDTANITFQDLGSLSFDVTSANVLPFLNGILACSDTGQAVNSIVYDVDGSVIKALGMDNNAVLGFSSILCSDDTAGTYTRGWSVLNGRFIDGNPETPSHSTVTLEAFKNTFIHEFGHLIGLDHSQINLNCLTNGTCPEEDLAGLPLMFPVLLDDALPGPKTDDKAALSVLYPSPTFSSTRGRIQGRVYFSDGKTQAQGYNVIARQVGDSRSTAVSCVSGFLYTSVAGNPLAVNGYDPNDYLGSTDPSLIGFYDIPGLPPGQYTIEVEAINNSGSIPFVGSSSVGPIGADFDFQFKMPGACSLQYMHYPSSPNDSCDAYSTITVGAGETVNTQTDIILLGTPSRYDAWEDGP
jgi:hypothetical protein